MNVVMAWLFVSIFFIYESVVIYIYIYIEKNWISFIIIIIYFFCVIIIKNDDDILYIIMCWKKKNKERDIDLC